MKKKAGKFAIRPKRKGLRVGVSPESPAHGSSSLLQALIAGGAAPEMEVAQKLEAWARMSPEWGVKLRAACLLHSVPQDGGRHHAGLHRALC